MRNSLKISKKGFRGKFAAACCRVVKRKLKNIKIAARAVYLHSLLRCIFDLLIFEMFNDTGTKKNKRKFWSRYAINTCNRNFTIAWKRALKKGDFLPKSNGHYIFRVLWVG